MASKPNKKERRRIRESSTLQAEAALAAFSSGHATDEMLSKAQEDIKTGLCPFCGLGPYRVPLGHVFSMHGILSRVARDMLLLTYTESLTCQETNQLHRVRMKGINPSLLGKSDKRVLSVAAKLSLPTRLSDTGRLHWLPRCVAVEMGRKGGSAGRGKRRSEVSHGTRKEYRKGCRCQGCTTAHRRYWCEYRRKGK